MFATRCHAPTLVTSPRFYTRRVLIGHEREMRQLRAAVDALGAGQGELVLIAGEAGIGKTRLAEETMRAASGAGVASYRVTCWAEAGAPPFWPWSQLLAALGRAAIAVPVDAPDPELARFALFSTIADALRDAGRDAACLLVIDDLHWADSPSVRLLAFVAPMLRDAGVLVLATYRDNEAGATTVLGAALPDLVRHGRQLVVPPLDRRQLESFVDDLALASVSDAVMERLYALTAGNPLFTREVVSLLAVQDPRSGAADDELPLPESVRATLTQRLASISDDPRESLGLASVVGVDFRGRLVADAGHVDHAVVLQRLDEALSARLVRADGPDRFAFAHPLIRETAYRDLGLARRVRLHEEVGKALERASAAGTTVDPAELAHHFRHASPGGNARQAVEYAADAGRQAMALLAYEAAVMHFEQALETLALCELEPAARADLLLDLGDARIAAGDMPGARSAFVDAAELARAHDWPTRLARAALGCGSGPGGFEVALFDAEHIELLGLALDALGESEPATRAWLLARLSVARSIEDSDAERLVLSEDAITLARAAGDDRALAYALAAHCDAIPGPEFCERRLAEASEIVALARAQRDPRVELLGRRLRVMALAELGRFAEFDEEVEIYARAAGEIRQPLYEWYAPLWRGMRALMHGDFERAAAYCGEAEAIGESAQSDNALMLTGSQGLFWNASIGLLQQAYDFCSEVMARFQGVSFMMRPGTAMLAARLGRLDEATEMLDRIDLSELAGWGAEWLPSAAFAADAAARCRHPKCQELYDALLPFRDLYALDGIAASNLGAVEQFLGQLATALGRTETAREHFAIALRRNEAVSATLLVAETRAAMELAGLDAGHARDPSAAARTGALVREGDVWALTYEGRTARLRHSKGMADLACLVSTPGREFHVLDLTGTSRALATSDSGPRLDDHARAEYKRRLLELEHEIDDADAAADTGRSERLGAERDALLAELSGAYGIGGRARRAGDPAERARSAVTQRIRDALTRIEAEHPPLGSHLRRSVRTGLFCVYEPDGPVTWEIRASQP